LAGKMSSPYTGQQPVETGWKYLVAHYIQITVKLL
jgi:hypothetical protein